MKTLALIVRRPDHTRDAFRAHYEEIHAPLAMSTIMEGTVRYVRHHVASEIAGSPVFDVVSAFWYRNAETAGALMARLDTDAGARVQADEATFMDRERNTFFAVTEHLVSGAEDRDAPLAAIALVKAPAEADEAAWLEDYEARQVSALLDATRAPAWCLQNRALGPGTAFDRVTQVHAAADGGLSEWAEALRSQGAGVVVVSVTEHETETPWS